MNVPIWVVALAGLVVVAGLLIAIGRVVFGGGGGATYALSAALAEPTRENRLLPDRVQCPKDGRAPEDQPDGPLPKATYTPNSGRPLEGLFAPGQIVAFEFLIDAANDAPSGGALDFEAAFPRASQRSGGFDPERKVVCAFVDPSDPSARERDGAKATARFSDLPPTTEDLRASFAVQGVEPGDRVVVEVWLAAPAAPPDTTTTLSTRIDKPQADLGRKVSVPSRPLEYRMSFYDRQEEAQLTLTVDDSQPVGPKRSEQIRYALSITNTSQNAIAPAAQLGATLHTNLKLTNNLQVVDTEGSITSCSPSAAGFNCNLGFVNPGETVSITAEVAVKPGAERRFAEEKDCKVLNDVCSVFALVWQQSETSTGQVQVEEPSDLPADQALSITKLVPVGPYAYPGQKVTFTYRVSNGGQTGSYAQLKVSDNTCKNITGPSRDPNGNSRLDPGESWDYECTIDEMVESLAVSTSQVDALTDDGKPVNAPTTTKITLIKPSLGVSARAQADDPQTRSVSVTNAGDAVLDNVAVTALPCGPLERTAAGNNDAKLDPGETWSYTCKAEPNVAVSVRAYATDPLERALTATSK